MEKEKSNKKKFICPNGCKNFRMLNAGTKLALCDNPKCDFINMIPEKRIKRK